MATTGEVVLADGGSAETHGNVGHHMARGTGCPCSRLSFLINPNPFRLGPHSVASFNLDHLPSTPQSDYSHPLDTSQRGSDFNMSFTVDMQREQDD